MPGAQVLVARKGKIIYNKAFGYHTQEKINKYSPGMHIPIVPVDYFRNNMPDIAYLFAWNHKDEIFNKEKELRDLQKKRFGFEGDLFKKRQELIKPIQDRVYNAVQKLAVDKQYDFILDKSEGITVIFADPKLDRSDDVLRNLGVK